MVVYHPRKSYFYSVDTVASLIAPIAFGRTRESCWSSHVDAVAATDRESSCGCACWRDRTAYTRRQFRGQRAA